MPGQSKAKWGVFITVKKTTVRRLHNIQSCKCRLWYFGFTVLLLSLFLWGILEEFRNSTAPTIFPELPVIFVQYVSRRWGSEVKIIQDIPYLKRITVERAWFQARQPWVSLVLLTPERVAVARFFLTGPPFLTTVQESPVERPAPLCTCRCSINALSTLSFCGWAK